MIDEGRPPLARVDGVGNFWHGTYGTAGWRDRAGAVMPGFTPNTAAANRIAQTRADAHLVDFGMPTVTTPANEAALGMERWNKAVLHGESKHYSILSNKNFGASGWPYQCADGTVYFMRAAATFNTPNLLEIRARKLDVNFTEPTAVLGSIEVAAGTGVDTVNFSPDGSAAAAHAYDNPNLSPTFTNTLLLWVAEIAVTGGSQTMLPSVSITLGDDDPINVDGPIAEVAVMETQWTLTSTTYENVTATTRDRVETHSAAAVQAIRYVDGSPSGGLTRPLSSTGAFDYVVMVAYTPAGARKEIRMGVGGYHNAGVPTMASYTPKIYRQAQMLDNGTWINNGAAVLEQAGVSLWDQTITDRDLRRISVDGSIVAEIEVTTETVRRGTVDPVAINQNYQEVDIITTISGPTKSGNGWNGTAGFVDSGVPFAFQRMAGNVLAMLVKTSTWQLLGWSAAHGNGEYSYTTPLTLTGNRMPAIHPESGALNTAIRLFF